MEPSDVVASLSSPWRAAFEQAWTSFLEGNFGIGAALFRPDDLTVVAEGRNLVGSARPAAQPLAGNFMAHAEMNAFASLESFTARGLHLVTTLEPCLMCGATAIFMNVERVDYAASDEFYQGFDENLWPAHPYTRDRQPETNHAFRGPLAAFARLLPLHFTLVAKEGSAAARVAREVRPALCELATSSLMDEMRAAESFEAALAAAWPSLVQLSDSAQDQGGVQGRP